ncbi:AAA family ATPase [Candidatus Saccharibacteria bacterium]|nr:AAA family ATPase [Candidatus Saccharibacteria bacterium]
MTRKKTDIETEAGETRIEIELPLDEKDLFDEQTEAVKRGSRSSTKVGGGSLAAAISGIELGSEQAEVFKLMEKTSDNYFITGKAGAGKSVLLSYFITHTDKQVAVVAPTGVAAVNVGGQTIHSFFKLGLGVQDFKNRKQVADLKDHQTKVIAKLDTLVIDEISMVSADVLDMIDAKMRYARGIDEPFGGCQVIAFGDLYQLSPIAPKGPAAVFMADHYDSIHFFSSNVVKERPFHIIELTQVFRQTDPIFIELLNQVRLGRVDPTLINSINSNCLMQPPAETNYITLTAINQIADALNESRLMELSTHQRIYESEIDGAFKPGEYPAPSVLVLRTGAQIMMAKNDHPDEETGKPRRRWVNGSLGTIAGLGENAIWVEIDGREYRVEPEEWDKYEYTYNRETGELEKHTIATFRQFPIKLAYAITIHKSQGQTYDAVKVDLGRGAFATGQTYVALSRCRSLETLYLEKPLRPSDIRVDQKVIDFMENNRIM